MVPFRANVEFQTVVMMIIKIFQRVRLAAHDCYLQTKAHPSEPDCLIRRPDAEKDYEHGSPYGIQP